MKRNPRKAQTSPAPNGSTIDHFLETKGENLSRKTTPNPTINNSWNHQIFCLHFYVLISTYNENDLARKKSDQEI